MSRCRDCGTTAATVYITIEPPRGVFGPIGQTFQVCSSCQLKYPKPEADEIVPRLPKSPPDPKPKKKPRPRRGVSHE